MCSTTRVLRVPRDSHSPLPRPQHAPLLLRERRVYALALARVRARRRQREPSARTHGGACSSARRHAARTGVSDPLAPHAAQRDLPRLCRGAPFAPRLRSHRPRHAALDRPWPALVVGQRRRRERHARPGAQRDGRQPDSRVRCAHGDDLAPPLLQPLPRRRMADPRERGARVAARVGDQLRRPRTYMGQAKGDHVAGEAVELDVVCHRVRAHRGGISRRRASPARPRAGCVLVSCDRSLAVGSGWRGPAAAVPAAGWGRMHRPSYLRCLPTPHPCAARARRAWRRPGLGVQLANGRLLIPANHAEDVHEPHCPYLWERKKSRMVAHCIYSDDHGKR